MIHFSVVEQALVRCSKKAGRQTFGQPRKGLYSFGKDYVCSVSAAKDSLNVYLENNPRYPVKCSCVKVGIRIQQVQGTKCQFVI